MKSKLIRITESDIREMVLETLSSIKKDDDEKDDSIKAVIFDFDATLVDTHAFWPTWNYARMYDHWSVLDEIIPDTKPYPGIKEVVNELIKRGIKIFVVTNNKESVAAKTLKYHGIPYDDISGIVDEFVPKSTRFLDLLSKYDIDPHNALSIGDLPYDKQESKLAKIWFVGCCWGNTALGGISDPMDILELVE
jgi:phosphoglycolate phosphatase-like HAD superfamily hydrolase